MINHNGKEYLKIYIYMNHFAVQQKLTQHCESTILQLKNEKKMSRTPSHGTDLMYESLTTAHEETGDQRSALDQTDKPSSGGPEAERSSPPSPPGEVVWGRFLRSLGL